jgi:hypothetical protein
MDIVRGTCRELRKLTALCFLIIIVFIVLVTQAAIVESRPETGC